MMYHLSMLCQSEAHKSLFEDGRSEGPVGTHLQFAAECVHQSVVCVGLGEQQFNTISKAHVGLLQSGHPTEKRPYKHVVTFSSSSAVV